MSDGTIWAVLGYGSFVPLETVILYGGTSSSLFPRAFPRDGAVNVGVHHENAIYLRTATAWRRYSCKRCEETCTLTKYFPRQDAMSYDWGYLHYERDRLFLYPQGQQRLHRHS